MVCLFCSINVRSNSLLLLFQTRHLLRSHRTALTCHHDRLPPCLLPVRATAHHALLLFPLCAPKLLSPFPSFRDRRHALFIGLLGFFTDTQDIRFRDDSSRWVVRRVYRPSRFLLCFQHCQSPLRMGATTSFYRFLCGLKTELL